MLIVCLEPSGPATNGMLPSTTGTPLVTLLSDRAAADLRSLSVQSERAVILCKDLLRGFWYHATGARFADRPMDGSVTEVSVCQEYQGAPLFLAVAFYLRPDRPSTDYIRYEYYLRSPERWGPADPEVRPDVTLATLPPSDSVCPEGRQRETRAAAVRLRHTAG